MLKFISCEEQSVIAKMLLPTTLLQGGAEAHVGTAQRLQRRPSKKARLSRVCGTGMSEEAWQSGEERGQLTCVEERVWLTTSQERPPRESGLGNSAVMGGEENRGQVWTSGIQEKEYSRRGGCRFHTCSCKGHGVICRMFFILFFKNLHSF